MTFMEKLQSGWDKGLLACVGLDTKVGKIPKYLGSGWSLCERVGMFNFDIVNQTADLVCAYKPNLAFYENQGSEGEAALGETINFIHRTYPDLPVILDGKRTDIGSTNEEYVDALFARYRPDAITVNPYFGGESLEPFLKLADKGIIVLCRTSNPGAERIQDGMRKVTEQEMKEFFPDHGQSYLDDLGQACGWEKMDLRTLLMPLYQFVALEVSRRWNKNGNCALVVGSSKATPAQALRCVRALAPEIPILVPGIGRQGGDLEQTLQAGLTANHAGLIVNNASDVIYASSGKDFAQAARAKVLAMNEVIQRYAKAA